MGLEGLIVAARAAHPKLMGDAKEPVTSLFGPTVKGVRVVLMHLIHGSLLMQPRARNNACVPVVELPGHDEVLQIGAVGSQGCQRVLTDT